MGKTVGWKYPEVSRVFSTDSPLNLEHFDTNFMGGKSYAQKTGQKMDLIGVKIAWVDLKSNKYP